MSLLVPKIIVLILVIAANVSRWTFLDRRAKQHEMSGVTSEAPSRRTRVLIVMMLVIVGVVVIAFH